MGTMTDGSIDVRMSRRGVDAFTADINNDRLISFSAQRASRAKIGSAGDFGSLNSWVSFGKTYDNPPPTLFALKRGGRVHFNLYEYLTPSGGGTFYGNLYTLCVQESRCKAIKCIPWSGYPTETGDRFQFYNLENA